MYDKGGRVLRIEATSNDITFFGHYRKVVSRDGREEYKVAALKKSIYSLSDEVERLGAACERYLDDRKDRTWRGFNLFLKEDQEVLLALLRGEFAINGLSSLRALLFDKTRGQISRILRRLRTHGLLKRIAHSYRTIPAPQVGASLLPQANSSNM